MKKPKLLIVTTVPETLSTILRDQPRFLGHFLDLRLVTSPGAECSQVIIREELPVSEIKMLRGINPARDFVSLFKMIILLIKAKPEIVHSYTPKAGLVAMLAAFVCRVPIRVHTFTGLIFPTQLGLMKILLIWIDRLICACSTHVIPEGDGVKNDLLGFSITKKPLNKIGYGNIAGVDTEHYSRTASHILEYSSDLKVRMGIGNREFVFIFVGRLNRDKGIRELVSAFEALRDEPHLLLVGAVDHTAPVDSATLEIIDKHPRIHQLGFQEDIRPALAASDALVLSSYREGFPNVVLQAGAMELAVIATDISGANEVIERGVNGWLVPPRDTSALESSMTAAMNTPKTELAAMGRRARARIEERFERVDHWHRMLDFYSACLTSKHLPLPYE